ncbi:MAG: hypothetical protein KAI66_07135 [Lentisphaeria bacterium]|nr:hypothetical protein [Lentisphaeria bacterium]
MGALLLAFLELIFVMVVLMLFHSIRKTVGSASFYVSLGMFFVLGQIVTATGLMVNPELAGFEVDLGNTMLLSPVLACLLIVYVVDGTQEAQRLILAFLTLLFGYFYLANILASHFGWVSDMAAADESTAYLPTIFLRSRRAILASFAAHAVDFFVIPILFQSLHNRRCRLFFAVVGTLVITQLFDSFVYQLCAYPGMTGWWQVLRRTYLARATAIVLLGGMTSVYIHLSGTDEPGARGPFDIILDFFVGYGKARELERYIREWEGRYSVVVQQSTEFIFILDEEGKVLNANRAAVSGLTLPVGGTGIILPKMACTNGELCDWGQLWGRLQAESSEGSLAVHQEWHVERPGDGAELILDVVVSSALLNKESVAVVIARDVTERRRLEDERGVLQNQLIHSQRMEAVGQLAGGVAHDFNNMLHTIHCSVERLARHLELSSESRAIVGNIEQATSRATALTQQLLGFARKGKYQATRVELGDIVTKTHTLFAPVTAKAVRLKTIVAPGHMVINADVTQLQQVFMNILLNAHDAVRVRGEEAKIVFRVEAVAHYTPGWDVRPDMKDVNPEDFVCVRIRDNGDGIPDSVLSNIFDPFFTTKEVGKGTGMGLAMAYGCISNHHGWIHVETKNGEGTEFFIFLPRASD